MTRRPKNEHEAMPEIKSGMAFLSKTGKAGRADDPTHTATVIIIPTIHIWTISESPRMWNIPPIRTSSLKTRYSVSWTRRARSFAAWLKTDCSCVPRAAQSASGCNWISCVKSTRTSAACTMAANPWTDLPHPTPEQLPSKKSGNPYVIARLFSTFA